jgi:hypothetical protein
MIATPIKYNLQFDDIQKAAKETAEKIMIKSKHKFFSWNFRNLSVAVNSALVIEFTGKIIIDEGVSVNFETVAFCVKGDWVKVTINGKHPDDFIQMIIDNLYN